MESNHFLRHINLLNGTLRRYEAALEFYAAELSWKQPNKNSIAPVTIDRGERARNALKGHTAPSPFYPVSCEKGKED